MLFYKMNNEEIFPLDFLLSTTTTSTTSTISTTTSCDTININPPLQLKRSYTIDKLVSDHYFFKVIPNLSINELQNFFQQRLNALYL